MKIILFLVILKNVVSTITIVSPSNLKQKFENRYNQGIIPSSLGNFGNPPYGSSITGVLVMIDASTNSKACNPLSGINNDEIKATPVILVDRGQCAFVTKVRNAENVGAKVVIVINDNEDDPRNIIMSDNGLGGNLKTPAFIISKGDGEVLKNYYKDSRNTEGIMVHIYFDVTKSGNSVDLTIWSHSSSYILMSLLSNLSDYIPNLDGLKFKPHYSFWKCALCESSGYTSKPIECVSGGRYCSYNQNSVYGRDIVLEDLREICIHNTYPIDSYRWFRYVKGFTKDCYKDFSNNCAQTAMKNAGIDPNRVNECLIGSFDGDDMLLDDNKLLRREREVWNKDRVLTTPAIL